MPEKQRTALFTSTEIGESRATVFDIQRFSIHDGPGIRTTIFFKGCPLRCRWCQNPESHKPGTEVAFYKENCAFCFACKDVCPENAIVESEGVRIDFDRCNSCGKCVSACMNNALRLVGRLALKNILKTYFRRGGMQVQFNVLDPSILLRARDNPDAYPNLLVRVSGYSAYFNDLTPEMKDEIIQRTSISI